MRKVFLFIGLSFGILSCQKEDIQPNNPPLPPQPIVTDSLPMDSTLNLVGQTWVIQGYRVGDFGTIINTSDTVVFIDNNDYIINNNPSTYSLYPTASVYNLTMNNTMWGNLSGTIYDMNIQFGAIQGVKFTDISVGSSNQTNYYLWMIRI
jgi:hypothetical protein